MTIPARTVAPEMTVGDLPRLFSADRWDAYPVVSDGKLIGIVSKSDALKPFASDDASPQHDGMMGMTSFKSCLATS